MKEKALKIRLASSEDIKKAVPLVKNSFNELYLTASIYSCFGIEKFICNEIENEFSPYRYFVVELNFEIVAFAEIKLFYDSSVAFLNIIAIASSHKKKGIANIFFEYLKKYFSDLGFNCIELDVFSTNIIAHNWYNSLGFKQQYDKTFYKYHPPNIPNYSSKQDNCLIVENFSSFQCLYSYFGFSIINLSFNNQKVSIGVIKNNAIIKETPLNFVYYDYLYYFLKKSNIDNLYFTGNINFSVTEFTKIDEIKRMKLIF